MFYFLFQCIIVFLFWFMTDRSHTALEIGAGISAIFNFAAMVAYWVVPDYRDDSRTGRIWITISFVVMSLIAYFA